MVNKVEAGVNILFIPSGSYHMLLYLHYFHAQFVNFCIVQLSIACFFHNIQSAISFHRLLWLFTGSETFGCDAFEGNYSFTLAC
jgi:hypothetical protein